MYTCILSYLVKLFSGFASSEKLKRHICTGSTVFQSYSKGSKGYIDFTMMRIFLKGRTNRL